VCPFLWFGQQPGKPLGDLAGFKTGMLTKANAQGIKTARANIRRLPKAVFRRLNTVEDVVNALFGRLSDDSFDALGVRW
jgi:superfamily I DNA and/or RNA helicase